MTKLIAGAGLLGLLIAGCSYTVELPPDERSPAVNTTTSPEPADPGMGSMPAGHGMPMGNPHEGMMGGGMMGGMSPHGAMVSSDPPSHTVKLADGLVLKAPEAWVPKAPASSMLQAEFSVPAVEGDSADGRVTVMSAGGSVQANIDRWIGQFSQPDDSATADKAKTEKIEVAGNTVHLVDISGTYAESRGMMGPVVQRPDYRMLAAIIEAPDATYFVKFYGPAKTVASQADAFRKMIEGLGKPAE